MKIKTVVSFRLFSRVFLKALFEIFSSGWNILKQNEGEYSTEISLSSFYENLEKFLSI